MGKHEKSAERFFSHGIENWDNYHNGYLNFGLWENGTADYLEAARNLISRVGEMIDLNEDSELLDVGCGMGAQDRFFAHNFKVKSIEAVDLTPKHINVAKSKLKRHKHAHKINYSVGNACNLAFNKEAFTHIISIEAPVNFNTREHFFNEAFKFLKPDGRLGVADFYLKRRPETKLDMWWTNTCAHYWHIPRANRYDLPTYKRKLKEAGFVDIELRQVEDDVIPGYYFEQRKKEVMRSLAKIRGLYYARMSLLLDYMTYRLWKSGVAGYVLVSARKPC